IGLEHFHLSNGGSGGQLALRPEAAHPDRVIWVAVLKLDPDRGIRGRDQKQAYAVAGIGYAGQSPAAVLVAKHVEHFGANAPQHERVAIIGHNSSISAIKWRSLSVHCS